MKKLLLHTCCGPCFFGVWEDLKNQNFEVTNFFYNPNIYPDVEYQKRFENFKKAITGKTNSFIQEIYVPQEYKKAILGFKEKPGRCLRCYFLRLSKTAEVAKQNNFDFFSTTLLVSPYQNREAIIRIGQNLSRKLKIGFLDFDWRTFFRTGQKLAKEKNLYRQKYCGCYYSLEEARS